MDDGFTCKGSAVSAAVHGGQERARRGKVSLYISRGFYSYKGS